MKGYYDILKISAIFLLLTLGVCGCNYLDKAPDDQLTMEMVFTDKIRTEDWLASVYSSVPSSMWGYFKNEGFNLMADDITIPSAWTPYGWANPYRYTVGDWSPTTWWDPNWWTELPKRIRTGLVFLDNVRVIPEAGLTEQYVEQMKYEVRFLNAYYYSLMISIYGAIPFYPNQLMPVDGDEDLYMTPQEPYDTVVDWVDKELLEVSKHLPGRHKDIKDWGRATSVMALAIRARMLLEAASPLFNGNPDYAEWKSKEGKQLINPTFDATKWKRAADAHRLLIQTAEASGYSLWTEYNADGSIDGFMSYFNATIKRPDQGNKEIIFTRRETTDLGGWQYHHLPAGIGGNAALNMTQELVDAFYMENGLPPILGYKEDGIPIINEASGYTEKGFSKGIEMRKTEWTGGGPDNLSDHAKGLRPITLEGTYNMYTHREPRFYASVIFDKAWLGVANRRVENFKGGKDTNNTFDTPHNGYNIRKRIALNVYPREGRSEILEANLYRLAEAYLGCAEAINESEGPTDEAYKYINIVRRRAGIPDLPKGLTKEQFREFVLHERRVEFNMEGIRFHDIRRWKMGEKYLNIKLYGMNENGTNDKSDDPTRPDTFYKRTFLKQKFFSKKMYLFPIPQNEMDVNPNLVQAPGY